MKVVINGCHGGFSISDEAFELYLNRKGIEYDVVEGKLFSYPYNNYYTKGHAGEEPYYMSSYSMISSDKDRADPDLIAVVEELGELSWGFAAELKVVEIPDDVEWCIMEYDGLEHIAEKHRTWS